MLDFIFENLIIFIIIAGGIAKWLEVTREAKRKRENPTRSEDLDSEELEEFIGQAERRHPVPAVPPPLPSFDRQPMPGVERSPVPQLKRKSAGPPPLKVAQEFDYELDRQADLAEQLEGLKKAKVARAAKPSPGEKKRRRSVAAGGLRSRLQSREELRQAFVLKEILQKPVGLR